MTAKPKYFRVVTDPGSGDAWFFGKPITEAGEVLDSRDFCAGRPYTGPKPHFAPLRQDGRIIEFCLASFDMPVVTKEVGDILGSICAADIERFPLVVEPHGRKCEIVNVISVVDCLDEHRSKILRWEPEHGQPDKVGGYRAVQDLTIDPSRVHGNHLFLVRGWKVAMIASETVEKALEPIPNLGVVFRPVS